MIKRAVTSLLSIALAASALAVPASAQVPDGDPTDLPFFSKQTPPGTGTIRTVEGPAPVAKTIDGDISDWVGRSSMYGGTSVYSGGEYIYQDHLFDANGSDDGRDAERLSFSDPLEEVFPEAYRLDALSQASLSDELGAPTPERVTYDDTYGDVGMQGRSDLYEVRLAPQADRLDLLARTTTMTAPGDTALLLLADTAPGETAHEVPFNSGLTTSVADVALLITDGKVLVADLATGTVGAADAQATAKPDGWTNALEASVALADVAAPDGSLSLAIASGKPNADASGFDHLTLETNDASAHPNVANVAFRFDEPVRMWFERQQALALFSSTIDPFFTDIDTSKLAAGTSEEYVPGPGYHARTFLSDPATGVPRESGRDGIFQEYGVFLPSAYFDEDPTPVALQWWLHWRGGTTHSGASIVPKVFKQFGEDRDSIVVGLGGRGTSTWYVGKGQVDFREVWADVMDTFTVDRSRVYVSGHSMGGWGSYLLPLLYPDRFAGAAPVAGPVTQGGWTGIENFDTPFGSCDDFDSDGMTPCFISENGGRGRDQHNRKLLDNARHVPYAILQGTNDELVWYWAVSTNAARLTELGYRYRFYTYPGYEHYSHPIMDQWAEAAAYLHQFSAPENPAQVTYKRDMPFEIATEEVQSDGVDLDFDFDSAYWMSGLKPVDPVKGVALFDGTSFAISEQPHVVAPDTSAPTNPGQTGPYTVTGLQWLDDPTAEAPEPQNAFQTTLTGASSVKLDVERMSLDTAQPIVGSVDTDSALALRLKGAWAAAPDVTIDDQPVQTSLAEGVLEFAVPDGVHAITITPKDAPQEIATNLAFTDSSDTSAQYSDTATLQARLTGGDAALAGEEVIFSLGSETASALTDADGVATATLPVTQEPGDGSATVTFGGRTGELSPSVATVPFTVNKDDSLTTLTVAGKGAKRSLVATLTDSDSGLGLAGRTIEFFVNGQKVGSAITDDQGVARSDAKAGGKPTFEARFTGDTYYSGSSATS